MSTSHLIGLVGKPAVGKSSFSMPSSERRSDGPQNRKRFYDGDDNDVPV
ncbi:MULTISPECIES: hypothetical protein [Natronorubrum]|uniref:Uncharacterized protein n=1 Tax=Natronorubrum bangense JCM 10635 TaxID=1227500 RepID=L9WPV7_9EURY|nr:hypothetical protein [Natronorubrum bangense]ELY51251.1 hypothetical protein C494_02845 [Natronorubrum bangense JCM 10635]